MPRGTARLLVVLSCLGQASLSTSAEFSLSSASFQAAAGMLLIEQGGRKSTSARALTDESGEGRKRVGCLQDTRGKLMAFESGLKINGCNSGAGVGGPRSICPKPLGIHRRSR